jgi:signal transduction histidine kinase
MGTRWLMPVAIIFVEIVINRGTFSQNLTFIVMGMMAHSLIVLLLLTFGVRSQALRILSILIDMGFVIASASAINLYMLWLGLIPVLGAAGFYGWFSGVLCALGVEAAAIFWRIGIQESSFEADDLPTLIMTGILLTVTGVLSGVLGRGSGDLVALRNRVDQQEELTKKSQDLVALVYQMIEVLSGSAQQAGRVQQVALDFCLDGLARLGARPTLVGAILLFGEVESGKTVLRVTGSRGIAPGEEMLTIPAPKGIIAQALSKAEPVFTNNPNDDPGLGHLVSLRECKSVYCIPMRANYDNFGVMTIGSTAPDAFFADEHVSLMCAIASQATVALQNASLYQSLIEERDAVIAAGEEARRQLADDLHAGPTQGVVAVAMRINVIRRLIEKDPEKAAAELYEVEQLARDTTKEIRHMLFTLRPTVIAAQGLRAGLEELVNQMRDTYSQKVELYIQPGCDENLDPQAAGAIFYIIEEAVNNARKHAQSEVIRVGMIVQGDALVVRVEDDGVGFDVESTVAAAGVRSGHLGMVELQDRAELINGKLHIDSAPGKGTRIMLAAPLARVMRASSGTGHFA